MRRSIVAPVLTFLLFLLVCWGSHFVIQNYREHNNTKSNPEAGMNALQVSVDRSIQVGVRD